MIHPAFIPILLSLLFLLMIRLHDRYIYRWLLISRAWVHNKLVERYGVTQFRYIQVRAEPVDMQAEVRINERLLLGNWEVAREQLIRQIGAVAYPYVDVEIYTPVPSGWDHEEVRIRATWKQYKPLSPAPTHEWNPMIKSLEKAFKSDQARRQ